MVDAKTWKNIALTFTGKLVAAGWSAVKACALVGLHRTAWYRHLSPSVPAGIRVHHADRDYPNRITGAEADEFMGLLNAEEYANLSVTQAYYRMLDAGHCNFSIAAAHRIVKRHGQNGDRRTQRPAGSGPKRAKPVLHANASNQLWSWDITMLHGPGKHTYRLYTVMDVFSRKVVGHRVEYTETAAHAAALIRSAVADNHHSPAVLHADNGAPMRAGTTLELAHSLGITLSYSRPRVSDDNPYSESLFKTVKYDLDFPHRFQDLQHARTHMAAFFSNYNTHHRHSGLNYYTPNTVHHGLTHHARLQRQVTLDACYARNPHRYRRRPVAPTAPLTAGINNNNETTPLSQTA
ncbi:IS3 family transposase [Pseudarthrobacter scleromae]|uniref:Transposase n=1 Tax=Pseudarthrobacter scleromae TaxID=158897 RepID=A0ABQ2CAM3_9MICC|nr:IS3 family transposase [Pseudarthrobacter scleromae]GGI70840.1 transposase [Pseudarthrobacter scleromae]